ncbi:PREDICTED: ephrin type-A receptor 1-like, partial [Nestor notabilis]|uniref:ephrin type-A receptor 1-like n=1 Tax=Nestor notabilis TaxID=176057 RepID=UPI0005237A26
MARLSVCYTLSQPAEQRGPLPLSSDLGNPPEYLWRGQLSGSSRITAGQWTEQPPSQRWAVFISSSRGPQRGGGSMSGDGGEGCPGGGNREPRTRVEQRWREAPKKRWLPLSRSTNASAYPVIQENSVSALNTSVADNKFKHKLGKLPPPPAANTPQFPQEAFLGINPCEQEDSHFCRGLEEQWSEVQQMINGTPVYMYQDCSVLSEGDTDHWLRTNWIYRGEAASRIYVELKFTVRDCKSFKGEVVTCKETFNLYYMESEQDVGIQFRRPLFIKLNTVAADRSFTSRDIESGAMQLNTEVCPIGKLSRRGFYLAFQNSGACVAMVSVRVYYKTCPEAVRGLARFPETLAGSEGLTEVPGVCVEYASEEEGSPPRMHCSTDGEWLVPMGRCLCAVGFEEVDGSCI